MACGTPVIAFSRGSVPEVVEHGLTGFIVDDEGSAVDAVKRVSTLSRCKIRAVFESRFTSETMARNYLSAYEALIKPKSLHGVQAVMRGTGETPARDVTSDSDHE
ncbi:hypothetical protein AAVH_41760 [Aphelenchoides avenae]|nr:hypothetical protein AAVH_41760 [Aphelenchus avenae]